MSQPFYKKWAQVYRMVKQKKGLPVTDQTSFGSIQQFNKKKINVYHVIKNISYAQYKSTKNINKKIEQGSIQLPFEPERFNFTLIPLFQVIAFVDLENEQLLIPELSSSQERLREHDYLTEHIIKIGKSQIAHGHSIFVPYVRQNLPQILKPRLIEAILKLSGILPGQKIGYNSQGAGSTVNNFHVQIIDGSSLLSKNKFHFESIQGQKVKFFHQSFSGSLTETQVDVSSFQYANAVFIRVACKKFRISDGQILNQVVRTAWRFIEIALANTVPHNLCIPNQHQLYIILRNFDMDYGWVEYSGVQITTNDHDFKHITAQQISEGYARLALPQEIKEKFMKFHKI